MTPERFEEMKNYIRKTTGVEMDQDERLKAFGSMFGDATFPEIDKALADISAEIEAERNKPAMVLLPEGFDLLALSPGAYQGSLSIIDKGILKCVSETLNRLADGFGREAKWFASEVEEAKDCEYEGDDKDFYSLQPFRKQADIHLQNLERGSELLSQIVAQLTLIGEQFNIPAKTEAAE